MKIENDPNFEQDLLRSLSSSELKLYDFVKANKTQLAEVIQNNISEKESRSFLDDMDQMSTHNLDDFSDTFYDRLHKLVTNILDKDQSLHISEFLGNINIQASGAKFKYDLAEVPTKVYNYEFSIDERQKIARTGESSLLKVNTPGGEHLEFKLLLQRNDQTNTVEAYKINRQSELTIPNQIAGQRLSKEDMDRLRNNEFSSSHHFGNFKARFKVDTDLNKVLMKFEHELHIPHRFAGIELSDEQRTAWINGKPLFLEGMSSKNGKFSGYVTFDQKNRTVSFSPVSPKEKVVLEKTKRKLVYRDSDFTEKRKQINNSKSSKINPQAKIKEGLQQPPAIKPSINR